MTVDNKPLAPAMNLLLFNADSRIAVAGLQLTAIGKVAHETQEGGAAQHPSDHPRRFGVSMQIVAPNDPGESYLLYKILASSRFPLDPNDPADTLAAGEADRLRLSVVTGVPMPAESSYSESHYADASAEAIWFADVEHLSQWIAAGAQLQVCK